MDSGQVERLWPMAGKPVSGYRTAKWTPWSRAVPGARVGRGGLARRAGTGAGLIGAGA